MPENPLNRAHAISATATSLLKPPSATLQDLQQSLGLFTEAAQIFENASQDPLIGEEEKKTLVLLWNQHKKLIRDVERRIGVLERSIPITGPPDEERSKGKVDEGEGWRRSQFGDVPPPPRRLTSDGSVNPTTARSPRREPVGLGSAATIGTWPAGISTRLGVPPFAIRQTSLQSLPRSSPLTSPTTHGPDTTSNSPKGPSSPYINHHTTYKSNTNNTNNTNNNNNNGVNSHNPVNSVATESFSLSPLHSSSSSDDSFLNLGVVPDTLDPFSRFWGMLENMLDDISNPVAFASAPLGVGRADRIAGGDERGGGVQGVAGTGGGNVGGRSGGGGGLRARVEADKRAEEESKGKHPSSRRDVSPAESFYVIPTGRRRRAPPPASSTGGDEAESVGEAQTKTLQKSPEELMLENENLRASLDEIAQHAEKLDRANKILQAQHDEREKTMRSIAVGMRREAQKVKQGQDLLRSQLVASVSNSPRSVRMNQSPGESSISPPNGEVEAGLRARIRDLEQQVKELKNENEKHKSQVDKYKDKIKANARAKRDARALEREGNSKAVSSGRRGSEED